MAKYEKKENLYIPATNRKDSVTVPENTIYVLTEHRSFDHLPDELISPLKGQVKRDWFGQHHYFCLPLTMGNQHGFIVKAAYDFSVIWDGGDQAKNAEVFMQQSDRDKELQVVSSHFGYGIITVQNRWVFRTPRGVNLLVMPPPNFCKHGVMFMTAVIETDQLRRDFTFNIKITAPNEVVYFKKGDPIGCVLPYPRYFVDDFKVEKHPEGEVLETERETMREYSKLRKSANNNPDMVYMQGMDVYRNEFPEHQKGLNNGMPIRKCPFQH